MYVKICNVGDGGRAMWIAQQKLEQCEREGKKKPSEMCPVTTVHRLVGEIKGKISVLSEKKRWHETHVTSTNVRRISMHKLLYYPNFEIQDQNFLK